MFSKKMKSQWFALILAATMCFSSVLPVTASGAEAAADISEQLSIPYVLDAGSQLPVSLEGVSITWSGSKYVSEDGKIMPDFESKKATSITATLSDGFNKATKKFPVIILGTDAAYLAGYTRVPDSNSNIYSSNLAYSMHLAYSEDGSEGFEALNDNSGVLFVKATSGEYDVLTSKSLINPYIFYMEDGSFGVVATRVKVSGETDSEAASSVAFFTSDDLLNYKEVGLIDMKTTLKVNKPVCEYDSSADVYRITWNDENGNYYQNIISDLTDLDSASSPESAVQTDVRTAETGISGATTGNVIALEYKVVNKVKTKLSDLVNTSVKVPEVAAVTSEEDVDEIKATAYYNDGSTVDRTVTWDTGSVDWSQGGTYTIQGTVNQSSFNYNLNARPDPQMVKYNGKFYFISTDESGQSRIYIREMDKLTDLKDASESLLLNGSSYPNLFKSCLWAPELHVIEGELYIFFAGSLTDWSGVQCHVMKLTEGGDPTVASDWEEPIRVLDKDGNHLYASSNETGSERGITLDMTYFEVDDQAYVVWAQRQRAPADNGSWLYIATVDKKMPWQLTSDRVAICKPDYGWDNNSTFVVEGPYLIQTDDNLYLTFSGAGVNPTYAVGIMTAERGSDLLDADSWNKGNYPILTSRSVDGEYGPGHNSYVYDEDGLLYNVYHAKWGINGTRSASLRRVHFGADGMPVLDLVEERDLISEYKNVTMQIKVVSEAVTVNYKTKGFGYIEGQALQPIEKGGNTTMVTAAAGKGYEFSQWSDGNKSAARRDMAVNADKTVTAIFVEKAPLGPETDEKFTVKYLAGTGGKISGKATQTVEKDGSTTAVTAVADSGYVFSKWSDGSTSAVRTDKNIKADMTVTAIFTKVIVQPAKVSLNKNKITLGKNESFTLVATVTPKNASQTVTWISDKPSVVKVEKGKITAKKVGSATITATTANGRKATCTVTVKKAPNKVSILKGKKNVSKKTITLGKNKTMKLKAQLLKKNKSASYKLTWKSSKSKIVKIVSTSGTTVTLKGLKKGTSTITVKTFNGKTSKVIVKVK